VSVVMVAVLATTGLAMAQDSGKSPAMGKGYARPDEIGALTEEATIWSFPIVGNYRVAVPGL
jgi:hypothetical protein